MTQSSEYLIVTAIGLVLSAISLLALTKKQRKSILDRISPWLPNLSRRHRDQVSKSPPRSLSPEKKVPNNAPPAVGYTDVFPPSTRETLPKAAVSLSTAKQKILDGHEVDVAEFRKNIIPLTADYRECGPSTYTPMEISKEELKALGDFPDYATLSGVPLPEPYKEFKIETAISRPYRPFRWAYHQTMSLTKMETNWWLELEKTYATRIAERQQLYKDYGKLVLQYLPGSELACKEIMEMALQFVCARYPQYFSLVHSDSKGYVFKNGILGNETVIKEHHALHVLLDNIPEDFAIVLREPKDGMYYFRAGVICSSLGWNVDMKIGMQLKEIHKPIPDYKEKMEFSMDRYFSRLPPSRPIQRGSWGLEVDTPLFMPPNDPHETLRLSQDPSLALSRIHLRVDWQTLRRLPLSGAIVFNFKGLFTPITEFRDEPYVPALCKKVLENGKRNLIEYKNTWHVEHKALPALGQWAAEQVEKGERGEEGGVLGEGQGEGGEVRTLEESPWFPGWEAKWHRQQGF